MGYSWKPWTFLASKNVEGFRKNYANVIHSQAFDHLKQLVITFLYTKEIGMIKIRRSGRRNFLILHMEHFVEKKIKKTSFFGSSLYIIKRCHVLLKTVKLSFLLKNVHDPRTKIIFWRERCKAETLSLYVYNTCPWYLDSCLRIITLHVSGLYNPCVGECFRLILEALALIY